ncbi:MAG: shikimate dehydrogenase [Syntrophobacterales bacterium]|nr:shikimate dehydrogenase [Syntrophobacterales bacterium]
MIRPAQERLFGVIGQPVGHSLSPIMMNRAFEVCKLPCHYLAMEVTELEGDLEILSKVGFEGLSVTVPYKEDVMRIISNVDADAAFIGSVNTLKRFDNGWEGKNTDWLGVIRALEEVSSLWTGKRALVVGAGGASRAVVFALRKMGMDVTVANRTIERAEVIGRHFSCRVISLEALQDLKTGSWDLIVQTTSVGMRGYDETRSPVPASLFSPKVVAMDIVYTPKWTVFLRDARERGAHIIFGSEMLLYQGAHQFEWWLGIRAPIEAMREALENALEAREVMESNG